MQLTFLFISVKSQHRFFNDILSPTDGSVKSTQFPEEKLQASRFL